MQQKAQENGLLLLSCGVYGNVIRFLYPLTIPDAQFSKALDILARVLVAPQETQAGIVATLAGAPVFLFLMTRRKVEAL